jgi:SAM-dependent methyltransferase
MTAPVRSRAQFYEDLGNASQAFHALIDTIPGDAEVLELGCGADALAFDLAARGVEVLGVSTDIDDVERARHEAERRELSTARFAEMAPETLLLPDACCDVVVGVSSLHRLDIARTYAEMARVLRPGGRGMLLEALGHNPVINAYRRRTLHRRDRFEHPIRRDEIDLARRWFDSVRVETHHLLDLAAVPVGDHLAGRAARSVLRGADRLLLRPSSPLRWHAWIAVVELEGPRP